jgi:hypothetical protein
MTRTYIATAPDAVDFKAGSGYLVEFDAPPAVPGSAGQLKWEQIPGDGCRHDSVWTYACGMALSDEDPRGPGILNIVEYVYR